MSETKCGMRYGTGLEVVSGGFGPDVDTRPCSNGCAEPAEPVIEVAPGEQTLENGGLTQDDAWNIVYGVEKTDPVPAVPAQPTHRCGDCYAPIWSTGNGWRDHFSFRCPAREDGGHRPAVPVQEAPREPGRICTCCGGKARLDYRGDGEHIDDGSPAGYKCRRIGQRAAVAEPQAGAQVPSRDECVRAPEIPADLKVDWGTLSEAYVTPVTLEWAILRDKNMQSFARKLIARIAATESTLRVLREERDRYTRVREMDVQAMKKLAEAAQAERESRKQAEAALRKGEEALLSGNQMDGLGERYAIDGAPLIEALTSIRFYFRPIPQEPAEPESGK